MQLIILPLLLAMRKATLKATSVIAFIYIILYFDTWKINLI